MPEYRYSPLSLLTSIRLLRLLPCGQDAKTLRCELFEYHIRDTDTVSHLYEALSYVWGSEDKPRSIIIDNHYLYVTQNLHAALLRLRNHTCSRTIWVDAVCIDQANEKEKESQIPLIAEIYAKASRVLVWLGEAKGNGDRALEAIRLAGEKSAKSLDAKVSQQAIQKLLQRPWFRRIWVLQEMAAARHVVIMCGSTEIDGHAFCSGLELLGTLFEVVTIQVTFLIRGALFRSRTMPQKQRRFSLDICSLGELIDKYHTHKATRTHDKVYALLGMCLDDLSKAGLEPDYALQWRELMQRLVKFLLGDHVSVNAWDNKETAVLTGKGCILGTVSKVEVNDGRGGGQTLEASFKNKSMQVRHTGIRTRWTLPTSANPIQEGDVICLLQGASKLTIVRLFEDHLAVVMIAATPPDHLMTNHGAVNWPELPQSPPFTRDFILVWDWEITSEEFQHPKKYDIFIRNNNLQSYVGTGLEGQLSNATITWYFALILGDSGQYDRAEEKLRVAIESYEKIFGKKQKHASKSRYGLTPLCWAAGNGYDMIVDQLLTEDNVDMDLEDSEYGQTPLSWAAENGHSAVVQLLLETGKVDVDFQDTAGRTPLWWAAENGHDAVVQLLLETGKVDVDSKDNLGRTPLWWAAKNGHDAVVQLLLETGKVDVDFQDTAGQTPLCWAAENGHNAVVQLLLKTGKVDINSKSNYNRTPLSRAAENGHDAVVQLLLETGKVDVDFQDTAGRTPLSLAVASRHDAALLQSFRFV